MKYSKIFICLLTITLWVSCDKPILISKKFKAKDFPFSLNNYWEYEFFDALRNSKDTIRATVLQQDISIGGKDDLWMLEWRGKQSFLPDTQYVFFTDSIIAFYDYSRFSNKLFLESQYNFPFQNENDWTISDNQGTYQVSLDDAESVHFGKDFGKGFYLQRRASDGNSFSIHDNIMVVKGVGIVFRQLNVTRGIPFRIQTYFLLDYQIQ